MVTSLVFVTLEPKLFEAELCCRISSRLLNPVVHISYLGDVKLNFGSDLTVICKYIRKFCLNQTSKKTFTTIVIRYKVYSEQHARAGTNIQHVIYDQLARAGQNT